jgi:hypothetical protein
VKKQAFVSSLPLILRKALFLSAALFPDFSPGLQFACRYALTYA